MKRCVTLVKLTDLARFFRKKQGKTRNRPEAVANLQGYLSCS